MWYKFMTIYQKYTETYTKNISNYISNCTQIYIYIYTYIKFNQLFMYLLLCWVFVLLLLLCFVCCMFTVFSCFVCVIVAFCVWRVQRCLHWVANLTFSIQKKKPHWRDWVFSEYVLEIRFTTFRRARIGVLHWPVIIL